jgi:glycine betaine/proline transport system substrate-binding protein
MNIRKTLCLAAALVFSNAATVSAEQVKIGMPTWTGAQAIGHLLGTIVEEKIGGKVEYITAGNAVIWQAMDQGKGDIDVHSDVWMPNQGNFADEYITKNGTVAFGNSYVGEQGYCVAKWFADEYNITDIVDLGRPEVAAAMDSDGNGLGEMWIGGHGWASTNGNQIKTRDYGLLDFVETIRADESVKNARVKDSIDKREGYAFYCAKPNAIFSMFDIVMLTEPTHDPDNYKILQPGDSENWYSESYAASKDAPKGVQIAYSLSLFDHSPTIAEFFSRFGLNAQDVGDLNYQIEGKGREIADVAKEWMEANPDRVDAWLGL